MANKKISELQTRTPSLSDLILVGDPSNGFSYKCTVSALATIIETDIADGYVTLGTTQTISGAKTFSNNLTLTSVANASTDPDKFLVLNGSNVVNYRTGSEVLSDIGGQGTITLTTTGTSGAATFAANTLNIPQYQGVITLTTTGTSGAATLVGNTLNIPNYAPDLSGYVPTSRTITINGTTQDLTANRTYNVGTVTSVAASAGTGISISGSPITSSGTITITNTAPDQIVALTAGTGISISGTYPNFTITNSSPSLGGTVTSVALSAPTGFAVTGSPITSSGTLALAFASGYSLPTTASQTNWDSAYNNMIVSAAVTGTTTKTLTLTQQDAGTITASWTDDNTDAVTSVFGRTGAVVAVSGDYNTSQVTESTNLYFTDARARGALSAGTGISYSTTTGVIASTITQYTDAMARAAISLTTTGSSGSATYSNTTGVLNIPTYTLAGLGGISLTSLSAFVPLSYNNTTGQFSITQSNSTNDGYLSATDWNTFNNKQATISLTTTGTSGAATFTSNTLNIPQYQGALTLTTTGTSGAATLVGNTLNIPQYSGGGGSVSGTTNYIAKFTSSTAVGNSLLFDNGSNIGVAVTPSSWDSAFSAIQLYGVSIYSVTSDRGNNGFVTNGYWDISDNRWEYIGAGTASNYQQFSGGHIWYTSTGTGTANAAISFTTAMTLNSSANLGLGTATIGSRLQVNGNAAIGYSASTAAPTNGLQVAGNSILVGTVFAGNAETSATPATGIISGTGGTGTNIAGAEFRIRGGASTGSGAGGPITFYTAAAGSAGTSTNAATERMRIDASGNLGLGVTPSVWTLFPAFQIGGLGLMGTTTDVNLSANAYYNGSWRYRNTGLLTLYNQSAGVHSWYNAVSGSANAAATIIEAMTLNASSNLGLSTNTIGSRLQVNGNAAIGYSASTAAPTNGLAVAGDILGAANIRSSNGTVNMAISWQTGPTYGIVGTFSNHDVSFWTNNSQRMLLNTSGNLGLGVVPSPWAFGGNFDLNNDQNIFAGTTAIGLGINAYFNAGWKYKGTGQASYYKQISGGHEWYSAPSGTAGNAITFTQTMTLNASGNLGLGTTTIGSRLQINGGAAIGYSASTAAPTNGLAVSGNVTIGTITAAGKFTIDPDDNQVGLAITGTSLTGSNAQSLIDLAQTWNTTGNPAAIKLNITNTASGTGADLMELQVGGVNQFLVTKAGNISLGGSITTDTPTGGTKKAWKLGSVVVTGSWVIDSSRYVEVEIDGTAYKLALAIAP